MLATRRWREAGETLRRPEYGTCLGGGATGWLVVARPLLGRDVSLLRRDV
jgi:hypothetical protein